MHLSKYKQVLRNPLRLDSSLIINQNKKNKATASCKTAKHLFATYFLATAAL
jgi:hypothetical protein